MDEFPDIGTFSIHLNMAPDPALHQAKGVSTRVIRAPGWGVKGTTAVPSGGTLTSQTEILRLKQVQWLVWGHREYGQDQGWGAGSSAEWFAHLPTYRKLRIYCGSSFPSIPFLTFTLKQAYLSGNSWRVISLCVFPSGIDAITYLFHSLLVSFWFQLRWEPSPSSTPTCNSGPWAADSHLPASFLSCILP